MTIRKELLDKANSLGLQFPKNISTEKLETLVVEGMEKAVAPPEMAEPITETVKQEAPTALDKISLLEQRRQIIMKAREKAFATSVVTLTNKDNRENDVATTAYLSFENQHFGISKLVPLDFPVELEQGLIDVAESTMITLHKAEIVDGKPTGNKVPVSVKKFAISYEKAQS